LPCWTGAAEGCRLTLVVAGTGRPPYMQGDLGYDERRGRRRGGGGGGYGSGGGGKAMMPPGILRAERVDEDYPAAPSRSSRHGAPVRNTAAVAAVLHDDEHRQLDDSDLHALRRAGNGAGRRRGGGRGVGEEGLHRGDAEEARAAEFVRSAPPAQQQAPQDDRTDSDEYHDEYNEQDGEAWEKERADLWREERRRQERRDARQAQQQQRRRRKGGGGGSRRHRSGGGSRRRGGGRDEEEYDSEEEGSLSSEGMSVQSISTVGSRRSYSSRHSSSSRRHGGGSRVRGGGGGGAGGSVRSYRSGRSGRSQAGAASHRSGRSGRSSSSRSGSHRHRHVDRLTALDEDQRCGVRCVLLGGRFD
jgi:hypothetical protein